MIEKPVIKGQQVEVGRKRGDDEDINFIILEKGQNGDNGGIASHLNKCPIEKPVINPPNPSSGNQRRSYKGIYKLERQKNPTGILSGMGHL